MHRVGCVLLGVSSVALFTLQGCANTGVSGGLSRSPFSDMVYLQDSHSARASSWDRSGGNIDFRDRKSVV